MKRLLTIALVFATVPLVIGQELRTLATHESPTKEQLALLDIKLENLEAAALKANVEIVRDNEDILLFDADLYNIRQMTLCIEGFDVLTGLLREGKKMFLLGDLEPKDREAVRAILLAQSVGEGEGPALFGDKAPITLTMHWRTSFEKGGVIKKGWTSDPQKVPKNEGMPVHSNAENEKFAKEELPKRFKPWATIGSVQFKCSFANVDTTRRTGAIRKLMDLMDGRMAKQDEANKKKEATMIAAYGAKGAPRKGEKTEALSEQLLQSLRYSLMDESTNEQTARGLLEGATMTDARPLVFIGISYLGDKGVGRTHVVPTRVRRGF